MYRRTTIFLTAAVLLFALLAALPDHFAQARAKKQPTPSDSPSAAASASETPTPTPVPAPTPPPPPTTVTPLQSAISGMAKIQTLVEFYYMNTGTYPVTLEELNTQYNDHAPKEGKRVQLPLDPATSKPFVYSSTDDGSSYSIRPPQPDAYGVKNLQLTNIDWGWMRSIADEHKRVQLTELCSLYIKGLANALDAYARDNKNGLPDTLETLVPKYVKKLPICPVNGKPYLYKKTARGYTITCPGPKAHDLEILEYSNTEGFKRR